MNYFIAGLMILLSSIPVFAQGKIGGGGYYDPSINYDYVYTDDESEGSISPQTLKEAYFVSAISSREKVCRPNEKHYLHGGGLLKVYVGLQGLESYQECLFSPYVKQTLKEMLEDRGMASYLVQKYRLPYVRVSLILVYFQIIYQGYCTDACTQ